MSELSIFQVLQQVADHIPGCLMTSVVDGESGMSLASVSPRVDAGAAAGADAFHSDLYRLVQRSMAMLEAEQDIEGVVLVGEAAIFISAPLPQGALFWHVVTDLDTTVGFSQALMRKYLPQVQRAMAYLI